VRHNGFVPVDDDVYITANPAVLQGLTRAGAAWALTATLGGSWHPLTWLAHMADVSLFGVDPAAHHLVSVGLHAANAVLLLLLLARLTGRLAPSAVVAGLFALHPLRVESVAWAAERKDVLSALFLLLALLAYVRHAARPGPGRYLAVAALFALGLCAKPMLVTLPLLLLLLDGWPLGRFRAEPPGRLLLEKAPLLALSAAASAVTYFAQRGAGAMGLAGEVPAGGRLANAVVSYAAYLGKALWPVDLAVFYPYPAGAHPAWRVGAAVIALAGLAGLALAGLRRRPWRAAGLLWYLVALVPVVGVVQVGAQAMADRYTYVPLVGIFLALTWEAAAAARIRGGRTPAAALAVAALLACALLTRRQVAVWRDGETLLVHALAVTRENWVAHYSLGAAREREGRTAEAVAEYEAALRIRPGYVWAENNLGRLLALAGDLPGAIGHLEAAVRGAPRSALPRLNLGLALEAAGRAGEAAAQYAEAARLDPGDPVARAKAAELR
jgi:tetratricopeptide (TPR) repeat protein